MRVSLFSWNSNPKIDKPYRVNVLYAEEHVTAGRADLRDGYYQMRPPAIPPPEREFAEGSAADWHTQQVSMIPDGKFFRPLRITTLQLAGA